MDDKDKLDLAKIGIIALMDEATGYQKQRKPENLKEIYLKMKARKDKK